LVIHIKTDQAVPQAVLLCPKDFGKSQPALIEEGSARFNKKLHPLRTKALRDALSGGKLRRKESAQKLLFDLLTIIGVKLLLQRNSQCLPRGTVESAGIEEIWG
jgi:hypothetical protein